MYNSDNDCTDSQSTRKRKFFLPVMDSNSAVTPIIVKPLQSLNLLKLQNKF